MVWAFKKQLLNFGLWVVCVAVESQPLGGAAWPLNGRAVQNPRAALQRPPFKQAGQFKGPSSQATPFKGRAVQRLLFKGCAVQSPPFPKAAAQRQPLKGRVVERQLCPKAAVQRLHCPKTMPCKVRCSKETLPKGRPSKASTLEGRHAKAAVQMLPPKGLHPKDAIQRPRCSLSKGCCAKATPRITKEALFKGRAIHRTLCSTAAVQSCHPKATVQR